MRLSHETIYTALYLTMPRGQLRARVLTLLRRAHMQRRKRSAGQDRRGKIANMTLIDARPSEIQERLVPGHSGGRPNQGPAQSVSGGHLGRANHPLRRPGQTPRRQGQTAAAGFARILNRFQAQMRRSMTYDQGSEMARHQSLEQLAGLKVYFAHPHSPWERGINENTNGLLRQYLPRAEDLGLYRPGATGRHRRDAQRKTKKVARMESPGRTVPARRKLRLPEVLVS